MGLGRFELAAQLGRIFTGCAGFLVGLHLSSLGLGDTLCGALGFALGGLALFLVRLVGGFGLGLHGRQFGPHLVTTDEVPDPTALRLETRLNGTVMQRAPTGDMRFGVADLLAHASTITQLEPGDVITTGTPGGVGFARQPPVWLQAGDVLEVEISGLGVLRNRVADEA